MKERVDRSQIFRINIEFKILRAAFEQYHFTFESPIFTRYSQWWHNTMGLYNQSEIVKTFAKLIGLSTEGEVQKSSLSISDDGFGGDAFSISPKEQLGKSSEVVS